MTGPVRRGVCNRAGAMPSTVLHSFHATRPEYEVTQQRATAWLAEAHAEAEAGVAGLDAARRAQFATRVAAGFTRCGCSPAAIATRGFAIPDLGGPARWNEPGIYDLARRPHGAPTGERTLRYRELVRSYFGTAYAADATPPDDLVHVTCTGYVSPSGGQELVAARGWPTRVTHAYHMGCYAAIPAVRIAAALAADRRRVDIVHTELCSLHLDPTDHRLDQLVVQSLFADGFIRYSATQGSVQPGFRVLATRERIVPDSADAMTWIVSDHGMHMTLARDVPERIGSALRGFVLELFADGGVALARLRDAVAAVHPGGPRIIDRVRDLLELGEAQVRTSRAVLHDHGNMSSATLPHIWQRILDDPQVPPGTLVPSFAFGPGLTICGALLEKQ